MNYPQDVSTGVGLPVSVRLTWAAQLLLDPEILQWLVVRIELILASMYRILYLTKVPIEVSIYTDLRVPEI